MMQGRDYDPNYGYLARRLHITGPIQRSDIGVNAYLCVAAHLKFMLISYHINK